MPFVKLDCGILNSTVWAESVMRDVFITALLMAEPYVTDEPLPQLHVRTMEQTGWCVPPGWYGFIAAAGIGILARALITDREAGLEALMRLGEPEQESRSQDFDGRRLIRVNGGYIALNFDKYRQRDETGAERQKRYRKRLAESRVTLQQSRVKVTQAEAEAEAEAYTEAVQNLDRLGDRFAVFWASYPRKVGKGAAMKEWMKLAPSDALTAEMVSAVQQQVQSTQWRKDGGQFIPHPRTWLSQGRWQDETDVRLRRVMSDAAAVVLQTLQEKPNE